MIPVVTPEEMRRIDEEAPEPVEVLIERAGAAVAAAALRRLGGGYGRRVVVVAGKGNNGADGRVAAARLRRRGVRVVVVDPGDDVPPCDLVIDAAYGTGFHGEYKAPDVHGAPVLSVDVPSGSVVADETVTFAALKPSLLFDDAAGVIEVADIGLDVSRAQMHLVEDDDVVLPDKGRDAHKWQAAVLVVAGSPGMLGAASLVARGAMRAGAGYVRLAVPGAGPGQLPLSSEAVAVPLPFDGWARTLSPDIERCRSLVVGPGLGRGDRVTREVRELLVRAAMPVVVDADGLNALAGDAASVLSQRQAPTVLTPHDGEFERLVGEAVGDDRVVEARALAAATGSVVLLKGSTTVVAGPDGEVLFAAAGGPRLATAGTGDVLSGVIGAFLAQGLDPLRAAAFAAHVHGAASGLGFRRGLVAGDLPDLIAQCLSGRTIAANTPRSSSQNRGLFGASS